MSENDGTAIRSLSIRRALLARANYAVISRLSLTLQAGCIIAALLSFIPQNTESQPTVLGIIGDDDRSLVPSSEYPWRAIGRLNNTLGPFCTGVLIDDRRVLTSAHCLWNNKTQSWLPPCALHFLAGYQRGSYFSHSLVAAYELIGGKPLSGPGPPTAPGEDWAVLILADDLGRTVEPLPTASLDAGLLSDYRAEGGVLLQAGYSRDRPHVLTSNGPCELTGFADNGRIVRHVCDATFGDSGSPILLERDGKYHTVAILLGIDAATGHGVAVTGAAFHESIAKLPSEPDVVSALETC